MLSTFDRLGGFDEIPHDFVHTSDPDIEFFDLHLSPLHLATSFKESFTNRSSEVNQGVLVPVGFVGRRRHAPQFHLDQSAEVFYDAFLWGLRCISR